MPSTSTVSMPSSPSYRANFFEPSTTGQDSDSAKAKSRLPPNSLLEYVRWCDENTYDARYDDPYLVFKALCRKYHGRRTKRGHSFHANKLRWLWFGSDGNNGPFWNIWTRPKPSFNLEQPGRRRKDELAVTIRCLSGGFTQDETEAVIKAYWAHNGEGYGFMDMIVYRATTFAEAMKFTNEIREKHAQENEAKQQAKTRNRILWALEIRGSCGAGPKEIAGAIGRDVQAVKQRLKALLEEGQVVKVKRGLYRLANLAEA